MTKPWEQTPAWRCRWVTCPEAGRPPFVTMYRCTFTLSEAIRVRIHVSGDERYELYLDRQRIGRGSERGDRSNWFYETYEVEIAAGEHQWIARCWALGTYKPWAQASVQPGFLLSPEEEALEPLMGTGIARWETKPMLGYQFIPTPSGIGTGAKLDIDGVAFDWDAMSGEGGGWVLAQPGEDVVLRANNYHLSSVQRLMRPAVLPAMQEVRFYPKTVRYIAEAGVLEAGSQPIDTGRDLSEEHAHWSGLLTGNPVEVPAHTRRRILLDLGDYYCLYPELVVSGGKSAFIRLHWAEALYEGETSERKTKRDELAGKWFRGVGDTFRPDGGAFRKFDTLWWHAGRYAELIIETGSDALCLEELRLLETRYPLVMEGAIHSSDERLNRAMAVSFRTLQMCSHETYMDCPYWEQLMYVGDTRIQSLVTYVSTLDDRLPRKALEMFNASRNNHLGLVNCAYPDQTGKHISTFSFWWVAMVYDYALWRGDREWVRHLMISVRDELERLLSSRAPSGLVKLPVAWNFLDWQTSDNEAWSHGEPPAGPDRLNAAYNLLIVHVLELTAKLEVYLGEDELASRARRKAKELGDRVQMMFWNEQRGLFADDTDHRQYSEHAQVLAILCEGTDLERSRRLIPAMLQGDDVMRTSIYFDHYTLEALAASGYGDTIMDRLHPWLHMEEEGLRTTPEIFLAETRSDCHAWGAHPIYHFYTNMLGIRPASMGFATVVIRPQPGPLTCLRGKMPHPKGFIEVKVEREGEDWMIDIQLPQGLPGTLVWSGKDCVLAEGRNRFQFGIK
ncbi:alpha-L-rhamnosidase C-terminal domain-containing protein [Paenibacillus whitsoniae]|uniref:Alpha-L-rhamnosidase n=1 Tax=Paenibacillus whitsoniae TaxID=2496558 RepID=A0A3S0BWH9_9BACL|nr:alpha-L-rhamnosidase C-terminal domain-containing protein [Paenibacillus whitsoniae]RTE09932.1 alpha-L-rhamnosidase [Paenibacillus whitsoniae]